MGDLLDAYRMVEIVCGYYDNEAKANVGQYYGEEKSAYDAATAALTKYYAIKSALLNEIEDRLGGFELC